MGNDTNIFNLIKKIKKDSPNAQNYHTGLLGEHLIVASYNQMDIGKLEKIRYIINKIIHKKKEEKRIKENNQNVKSDDR